VATISGPKGKKEEAGAQSAKHRVHHPYEILSNKWRKRIKGKLSNPGSLFVMAALWNRTGHYIFIQWFLLSFFFPCIFSAITDCMSTILPHPHMIWP